MSRSVNTVHLIGNVGNDPEVREASTGTRIGKLSLATNEVWKDKAGQKQEKTQWHRLTAFGKLVDIIEQYVKQGDRLYIQGRIEYSQTEADGVTKYWTDIVVQDMVMLGGSVGASGPPQIGASAHGDGMPF